MKWKTIQKYSKRAGKEVLAISEAVFLTMKDPKVSLRQKTMLPGGYADDIGVLLASLASVGKVGKQHLEECRLKHGLIIELDNNEETN